MKYRFSEKQSSESVLHFDELIQMLNVYETMNVFLLLAPSNKQVVDRFTEYISNDVNHLKRFIVCSRSPLLIYQVNFEMCCNYVHLWCHFFSRFCHLQLRKTNPNLICGLWLDKTSDLKLPSLILNRSIFAFAYGILFRNIIACVTGISVVFINKHDFNA